MSRPFIPVPNCASCELIYLSNGETVENVFHVQKGSTYSLSDLASLRGTINTWDSTTGYQLRSTNVALVRIRTKGIESAAGAIEDFILPTPRGGSQGGALFPNNVTFCYKIPTGMAGRSYRGRWYQVGLTTNAYGADGNHLNPTSVGFFLTWLNALQTSLASAGHTFVIVSYRHNKAWRTVGVATAAMPFVAVDYAVDSQRRRLTGRGRP